MDGFRGTGTLLRLALRRDRVVLPSWVVAYLLYAVGGTAAAVALYPDFRSRLDAAAAVNALPAMLLMYGRVWDPHALGSVAMIKPIGFGSIFAAILAILIVTRHTRTEEESGRLELVRALAVGRWAPVTAALTLTGGTMLLLAVVDALGVTAAGLPASSAWAWALSCALTGLTFAALAGVTAQLTQSARAANVLALLALAASFALRGTSDVAGTPQASAWWAWASPVGWQDQVRAFAGDRWWVLALFPLAIVALALTALRLAAQRDLDAGLLPQRAGRPTASPLLRSPLALTVRLQRGLLIGLFASYVALSLLLGAVASSATSLLDSAGMRSWLTSVAGTSNATTAFLIFELGFVALITALCGILVALRLRTEEAAGRLEPLLATAVSRTRAYGAQVATALLTTTALQATLAIGFRLADTTPQGGSLAQDLGMAAVSLPAIWVITAVAFLLIGVAPRATALAWAALAGSMLIGEVGPLLHWPSLALDLSPFTHVPRIPATPMAWAPEVVLLAITAALLGAGWWRFHRRDLAPA